MGLPVGQKLLALRESKGLTQREFADLVGVTEPTVSRWETTKFNPDRQTLERVADALDVQPGYLTEPGIPELDALSPVEVAILESYRLFLLELDPRGRRLARRYARSLDLPISPRTREGWRQLHAFIQGARRSR
jgi:transcriptional regulator with XRE-family HTH domain